MRMFAFLFALLALPLRAEEVDIELFLAVDVSRSMSFEELEIQRQGYAAALTSPEVLDAISRGLIGAIAVTYVEWAGSNSQKVIVPWTRLSTRADAEKIAAIITSNFETPLRRTSISTVLLTAEESIKKNKFEGLRRIVDISGDGPNNMGPPVQLARNKLLQSGIIINGLPLMIGPDPHDEWGIADLDVYFRECVIGGPGSFVIPVRRWDEFAPALRRKLILEIAGHVPARSGSTRFGAQRLIRVAGYDCAIGEAIYERNTNRFGLD